MKIGYFGGDWHMGCIDSFIQHGHQISHIFVNEVKPYNQKLRDYAEREGISVTSTKPTKMQLEALTEQGMNCFFSVEYPWLIPEVSASVYTINVHPTLLPEGRGPTPIIWLLKDFRQHAGVTFHKLANQFDRGDIIFQSAIELDEGESWETLLLKLHITIPRYLLELLNDFDNLYAHASVQAEGSYWPKISLNDRLVSWTSSVEDIARLVRACGRFGVVVNIAGQILLVNHIHTTLLSHGRQVGSLIREDDETLSVAVSDGVAIIMKRSILERKSCRPSFNQVTT